MEWQKSESTSRSNRYPAILCTPNWLLSSSEMCTYLKPGGLLYTWSNVNLRIDPGSQRLSVTSNLEKYLFASLSDMIFDKKLKERMNRDIFDLQRFHVWHLNPKRCDIYALSSRIMHFLFLTLSTFSKTTQIRSIFVQLKKFYQELR